MALTPSRIEAIVQTMVRQAIIDMDDAGIYLALQFNAIWYLRDELFIQRHCRRDIRVEMFDTIQYALAKTEITDYLYPLRNNNLIAFPGALKNQAHQIRQLFDDALLDGMSRLSNDHPAVHLYPRRATTESHDSVVTCCAYSLTYHHYCNDIFEHTSLLRPYYQDEPLAIKIAKCLFQSAFILLMVPIGSLSPFYLFPLVKNLYDGLCRDLPEDGSERQLVALSLSFPSIMILCTLMLISFTSPLTSHLLINTLHIRHRRDNENTADQENPRTTLFNSRPWNRPVENSNLRRFIR